MSNRCAKQQTIKDLGWGGDGTVDDSKKLCTIAYSIAHLGAQRKSGYSAPAYPDNRIITLTSTEPPAPVEVERRSEVATYAHILDSDTNLDMFMSEIYDNIDFSEFQTTTLLWDKSYSFMRVDFSVVDGIVHSYEIDRTSYWTNTLDGTVRGTVVTNTRESNGTLTVKVTGNSAADGMDGIIKHFDVQLPYTLHYKQETSRELISTTFNLGYFTLYCAENSNTIVISFDGVYEIKKYKITYDDESETIRSNKERIGQGIGSTNITINRRTIQTPDVLIFTPSMTNPTTVTFGSRIVSGQYWCSLYGVGATTGWASGSEINYTTEDLSISPYDD